MDGRSLTERVLALAHRNRPRRKPQLWENFSLAMRRRVAFEVGRRIDRGWLDRGHLVALSEVGFPDRKADLRMEVIPREMMNQALFLYGTFEISETRLIQSFLQAGMAFVDVGANIGYYTLVAARLVGPSGRVESFEPNDRMRARLEENVSRNGLDNVRIHRSAVASATGEVRFYASSTEENEGTSSLLPGVGRSTAVTVPAVSLDEFLDQNGRGPIHLVKIDVEGAELQVIEGGRHTLARTDAPALVFESFDLPPVADTLKGLGFAVRKLHYTLEHGLELLAPEASVDDLFADYEAPNYFAAKEERVFQDVVDRARRDRRFAFRLLGRL